MYYSVIGCIDYNVSMIHTLRMKLDLLKKTIFPIMLFRCINKSIIKNIWYIVLLNVLHVAKTSLGPKLKFTYFTQIFLFAKISKIINFLSSVE